MKFLQTLILAMALAAPNSTLAYGGGGDGGAQDSAAGFSNATTKRVVRMLTRGVRDCQRYEKVYRYDCYRHVYSVAARQLNRGSAYARAREILVEVEQKLARTIQRNADPTRRPLRRGLNRFQPIKASALPRAKRDFIAALETAETKLLRSADQNGSHYVQIAAAINSNKVLLRSAFLILPGIGQMLATVWSVPDFSAKAPVQG